MKTPILLLTTISVLAIHSAYSQTILIDFGQSDAAVGGYLTTSNSSNGPDSNGNFWNNYYVNNSTLPALVFTNNSSSGISLAGVGTQVGAANYNVSNGTVSLSNPNLNIFTAYTDGIYVFGTSATLTFSGLDPAKLYSFEIFGARSQTNTRTSLYTISSGNGNSTATLQTTGAGIGSGGANYNTSNTVVFSNLAPTLSNQITLTLQSNPTTGNGAEGAYINAMQLTVVPEPATNALLITASITGVWLSFFRKKPQKIG